MTHEVNRGIGYTVQRIGDEIKVFLPFLDPMDPVISHFKAPSVTFPADAVYRDRPLGGMSDTDIIAWVRGNIAG